MNNEQAKSVDIIFNRGLRQDLDPHTAPPGSLVSCQNLEFDQLGRLVKRDGYALIGTTKISNVLGLIAQVRRIAQADDGTRLLFADDNAFQYFPAQNGLTQAAAGGNTGGAPDGRSVAIRATMMDAVGIAADNNGGIKFSDAISVGTWALYLFIAFDAVSAANQVFVDVIDTISGVRAMARTRLGTAAGNYPPRLVQAGTGSNVVFALWESVTTTAIQYAKLDLSVFPLTWGVATDLVTNTGPAVFDADKMASGWVFVYYSTGSTRPVLNTYDSTPSVTHTVSWSASGGGAWTPSVVAIAGNSFSGSIVHVAGYNTGAFKLECASYSSVLVLSNQSSVDPGLNHAKHAEQMAIGHVDTNETAVSFSNYTSTASGNPRGHLYTYTFLDAGTLTAQRTLANYSVASRYYQTAITNGGYTFLIARFDDPSGFQNHFILLDRSSVALGLSFPGDPVSHFASGRVPLLADNAITGIGGIVDLASKQAGLFQFVTVTNIGASQYSGNQVQAWTFQAPGTLNYLSTKAQLEVVVGGGTPLTFDGQRIIELSFYSYPILASGNITPSAAGGSIAQGVYQYRAVFEFTDAKGNRHQSPASPAVTLDLSSATYVAGTSSVTLTVPVMQMTRKQGVGSTANPAVSIVFYRTLAGGSIFYRIPGAGTNRLDVLTAASFTDTYADSSISGNEPIYTSNGGQGLLSSTAPPPSIVLTTHAGRLWGVDCENLERIWCTRTLQPGSAPAYNPGLQILIPGAGRINGLAGQDGKLYALATNGIYLATYGDGPDDTGQGAFPSPELITSTANCQDPRGVLVGQDGIFFTGTDQWGTGIYLIRRGDGQPISIGKRVRNELAAHPVCRGVVNRTGKARTEFLFVDSDASPTSGVALYYHHDYVDDEGIGQWTTVPHVAIEALGVWDDQSVIAFAGTTNVAWQKVGTPLDPGNSDPVTLVETADIRPAGLLGFAQVTGVSMLGTQAAADPIKIEFSYDSGFSYPDSYQWTASTESVGQPVIRRREPVTQKQFDGSTIRLRLSNPQLGGAAPGQTYLHGVSIEIAPLGGNARLDAARRS